MSLTQRTIKAGFWALVQTGGRQLMSTLIFLALARFFLSKEDFGLVAMANVLIAFLSVFVRQGLNTAIIQRAEIRDDHIDAAFWVNASAGGLVAIAMVALAEPIAWLLGDARVAPLLQVLSVSMLLLGASLTHEALLSRNLEFRSLAMRTLIASATGGIVGVSAAAAGYGVWSLVAMQVASSLAAAVVLWSASPWRPRFRFSLLALRELLPTSVSAAGIGLVGTLSEYADQLIIGKVLGVGPLGVYVVAQKVVTLLFTIFMQAISSVALPSFSRLDGDVDRARKAMLKAMAVSTAASFPVFLGLAATADLVVPFLFGIKWLEASPVMAALCIWGAIGSVNYYYGPLLQALGHSGLVLRYVAFGAALMVALGLLAAQFGLFWFAVAVIANSIITLPLWLSAMKKHVGVTWRMALEAFGPNLLAALAMVGSVLVLRQSMEGRPLALQLALAVAIGAACYALALWNVANANARAAFGIVVSLLKRR